MRPFLIGVALLGVISSKPVNATTVISFDDITAKPYTNGSFISGVQFGNSGAQSYFEVVQFGEQVGNNAIRIGDASADKASALSMRFAASMKSLSLLFGPDDPAFINPGDKAVLRLSLGADLIEEITVVMDRDGLANQIISFTGKQFDNALFYYADAEGEATHGVPELVDNITFSADALSPAPAVPEPSTWAMLFIGLGGVGAVMRRRTSVSNVFA
jgi:hypothetical protein